MAFRADEAIERGNDGARNYLASPQLSEHERIAAKKVVDDIIELCGPRIGGYPIWHPLVANQGPHMALTTPERECGYKGLDHTVFFAHGFISCPYNDGQKILDAVDQLPQHACADITAERLNIPMYNTGTDPILIRCEWHSTLASGHLIPKRIAVPLMMQNALLSWQSATRAERWDTMRPYLLGQPHGARSSLFVDQETALAIKKMHNAMNESGMFGPLKMG